MNHHPGSFRIPSTFIRRSRSGSFLVLLALICIAALANAQSDSATMNQASKKHRHAPGPTGPTGPTGATGADGILDVADFYALMPPNNAVTVAAGGAVEFPNDGVSTGVGSVQRASASTFTLSQAGVYQVFFQVSVTDPGQLVLALDAGGGFVEIPSTVVGRATGTSQIVGNALIQTVVPGSVLEVRNPTGESNALTITPLAGGTDPVSAHLIITRLQGATGATGVTGITGPTGPSGLPGPTGL
jgi:hypothetical protein